ncbi:hypothetical protein LTR37_001686 [Vermiconidia calcicola]|uniref:Uncharacterized protein n=1 Tax=Vermiconidia calcicola TaxID=1690605 RepID=A0ACC3NUG0_9PEZI|nr:hypothetical protein LTR37_001686 [Vermiconidia calcicola]
MPLIRGRKRRAEPEPEPEADPSSPASSPEPATQRRRTTSNRAPPEAEDAYASDSNPRNAAEGQDTLVKKMVRLALACEYQRKPIRRAEISEKVLGSGTGAKMFKHVFAAAQQELRSVFGMEMVELPGREKVTVAQKRAAQKSQSQTANKAPTSWTLISILPPQYRNPAILTPASTEESKYTSLTTLLTTLILLSGNSLPDAKMDRYLRRLGLEDNTPLEGAEKTEKMLKRMERDGYLYKVKESNAGMGGEEDVFWVVGPRGRVEVGEQGVRGLVGAVYGEVGEEEEEELERRVRRSLGLGEGLPGRVREGEGARKKRGRKRRGQDEEDAEGGGEDEEEDDDDVE